MKKLLPNKGFTLIELMVVVAIIAVLSVIGVVAFSQAQKSARDGRRRADIDAIAAAYETNYNPVTSSYKTLAGSQFTNNAAPVDPSTNGNYPSSTTKSDGTACVTDSTCTLFCACAQLEISNGNAGNAQCGGMGVTNGSYYCKKSQQSQ